MYHLYLSLDIFIAPGSVLNFAISTWFTSLTLTWDPPDEPNGVIIRYEVTYRISDGNLQAVDAGLSTKFTISPLETGTRVSDVSVSAYTSVGRGVLSNLTDLRTLSEPRELLWWSTSMYIRYECICSYGDGHKSGDID